MPYRRFADRPVLRGRRRLPFLHGRGRSLYRTRRTWRRVPRALVDHIASYAPRTPYPPRYLEQIRRRAQYMAMQRSVRRNRLR